MNNVQLHFIIKGFTLYDAQEICKWKYEYPYDVYNYPSWDTIEKQKWAITQPQKRRDEFHSVYAENKLTGYFRLVKHKNYYLLGLGLNPEVCGKGNGLKFVKLILSYLNFNHERYCIQLEVRDFNKRAIKCYEEAGFIQKAAYEKETPLGKDNFILMEYKR